MPVASWVSLKQNLYKTDKLKIMVPPLMWMTFPYNPSRCFYPGQTINGVLNIRNDGEPTKMRGMTLRISVAAN